VVLLEWFFANPLAVLKLIPLNASDVSDMPDYGMAAQKRMSPIPCAENLFGAMHTPLRDPWENHRPHNDGHF
jgi:hypothetical protein